MTILVKGSQGYLIKLLQSYLKVLRYYPGEIDGNYGNQTQNAVDLFQTEVKIGPKEGVDDDTWNALVKCLEPITNQSLEFKEFVKQVDTAQVAIKNIQAQVADAKKFVEAAKNEAIATQEAKNAAEAAKNEAELASARLLISASVVRLKETARQTRLICDEAVAASENIQKMQGQIDEIIKTAKENVTQIRLSSPKSEADNAYQVVANAEKRVEAVQEIVKNAESLKLKIEEQADTALKAAQEAETQEKKAAIVNQNIAEIQNAVTVQEKAVQDAETTTKEALKAIQSDQQTISDLKAKVEEDVKNLGNNKAPSPLLVEPSNFSPLWDLFNHKDNLPPTPPPTETSNQQPDSLTNTNSSTLMRLFELDKPAR
ncbi:peptidoglycan-binding protein [Nostoc sp. FACHB-87]|uniref:peptidoglycan-binding domain-containing protein n=1 Tax=Nostocaceae TaxID=1162 RepID=UPI001688FD1A|nr:MULTISPECIES: peptidoglycan-binding protein [Nostocaceae]MBD2458338.1 peptidoglycan-binding protein [Nostoc sp. FACHB-87]MBD2479351.1 peptidoglycan-binding protein [Anabaena sp. FACHB-83]